MSRALLCTVSAALAVCAGPAGAQDWVPLQPVCSQAAVLAVVADDIVRSGVDAVIVPGDIGEVATGLPNIVRCAVRLRTTYFDTNRFGYAPQTRFSVLEFTVRSGRNSLFVDTAGALPTEAGRWEAGPRESGR